MRVKAISLTQPWASACVLRLPGHHRAIKRIETRSWPSRHTGPLFIHAAKGFPGYARHFANEAKLDGALPNVTLPLGAIIGRVTMTGCRPTEALVSELLSVSDDEELWGDYSPGRFGFLFDDDEAFADPIPCRGALGLWDVPDDVLALLPTLNSPTDA